MATSSRVSAPWDSHSLQPQKDEDDFGWSWDTDENADTVALVDALPPQLHPAVSLGLQRVSSCAYFSSVSEADMHSLSSAGELMSLSDNHQSHQADWLYHDVIMHVFTFLDAKSLAAFSETARRMNYEVFYFLELQLQRALLEDNLSSCLYRKSQPSSDDRLAAIAGSWTISRLSCMDKQEAQDVVQEYLDSNCTLRIMPLSHSMAYIRQLLRRNGFPGVQVGGQQQSLSTSAAIMIGLVGAAAVVSGNVDVEVVESFGTELPNMLFKVGFVGSLMGAARHRWEAQTKARSEGNDNVVGGDDNDDNNGDDEDDDDDDNSERTQPQNNTQSTMRETAEQMARTVQEMLQQVGMTAISTSEASAAHQHQQQQEEAQDGFFAGRMYDAFLAASGASVETNNNSKQVLEEDAPWSPNPYEHLPRGEEQQLGQGEEKVDDYDTTNHSDSTAASSMMQLGLKVMSFPTIPHPHQKTSSPPLNNTKMPSGCVGAYFRAISRASKSITELVQKERRDGFEKLPNKDEVARTFIDACCADDTLDVVQNLVQQRSVIDASGFYVGSDGTETCALHASAFHGATKVLEFLCGGIDERDPSKDEGLCCVDLQDVNGWTALHFAAGANCVDSVRILADRGANLTVVAENGYTPLQWAQRLSNHEVAEELRQRLEKSDPYQASNHRWIAGASQPLSMIAHRFFAMIPTH